MAMKAGGVNMAVGGGRSRGRWKKGEERRGGGGGGCRVVQNIRKRRVEL